jgi:hypothetical protein
MTIDSRCGAAFVCALVLLRAPIAGAPQAAPAPGESGKFIAAAREAALAYSSRLPDFICTQTVTRLLDRGSGLSPLDSLTFETSYYRQRETSRVTQRNGVPASTYSNSIGMSSRGEFGDNLLKIFAPASEAQFRFERWTSLRGRRAAVYSYRVDRSKAPYTLNTADEGRPVAATVGLRGELIIDAADFSVLRVEYIADDIPRGFPLRSTKVTVDYENAEIGGNRYLLPSRAEGLARTSNVSAKNESLFRNYRKFSAASVIEFGEQPPQP